MISGALEIIYGVEGGLVHPLRLPASQGPDRFGYIVISYDDSPDVYDILFVRGGSVEEYAGLHHELRTLLNEKSVRMGLAACDLKCRVYLFSVSRQGFDRFLLALDHKDRFIPWMYGVNGSMSVLGSVLAVILSMLFGFTPAYFGGLAFYAGVLLIAFVSSKKARLSAVAA